MLPTLCNSTILLFFITFCSSLSFPLFPIYFVSLSLAQLQRCLFCLIFFPFFTMYIWVCVFKSTLLLQFLETFILNLVKGLWPLNSILLFWFVQLPGICFDVCIIIILVIDSLRLIMKCLKLLEFKIFHYKFWWIFSKREGKNCHYVTFWKNSYNPNDSHHLYKLLQYRVILSALDVSYKFFHICIQAKCLIPSSRKHIHLDNVSVTD